MKAPGTVLLASMLSLLLLATACSTSKTDGTAPGSEGSTTSGDVDVDPQTQVLSDSLALSDDGRIIFAPCSGAICRWDTETGAMDRLPGMGRVAVSPTSDLMATVGDDASVLLVDLTTSQEVRTLTGHTDAAGTDAVASLLALAFSPDGEFVASAGTDGSVRVWSVADGESIATIETDNRYAAAIAFSPDSDRLAVTGGRDSLRIYDAATGDLLDAPSGSTASAYAVAWSGDGAQLAGAGARTAPTVWDAATFKEVAAQSGHQVKFVAFSPDNDSVAFTTLKDKTVRVWSLADDSMTELVGHLDSPTALAFSPDGQTLYSSAARDGVWAWDIATEKVVRRFV